MPITNRAVFLDRDGTMAIDAHYCRRPEDFHLFPDTARSIRLLKENGFKVIVITNQSGIGRGFFTDKTLAEIHQKMIRELAEENVTLDGIYYCPHHPDENCKCRKPKPALILQAARDFAIDLKRSYVVGDLPADVGLGKAAGCRTVLVTNHAADESLEPDTVAADIYQAALVILEIENGRVNR